MSAAEPPVLEARGTAESQIGAGVARRQGQCFVECPAVEVQRGAVGREDVMPRPRLVASPNRQHFRRVTTEWRLREMLETDARKRLSQFGRRRFAETPPIEVRLLDEQDTITRARREKSENAASRSGAGDREVVHGHRIHAKARKLVRTAFMPSMLPGLFFSPLPPFSSPPPAWESRLQPALQEVLY